ncbi:hypothetical protein AB6D05_10145 [Vibrio cyclitrophicus]|uniref:hypothetical protein n=1 Tax=Vibrio cyclitrophicus TaxID=47951 RepID=UPI00036BCD99|nr:hypothetical protein [Vibrio cyclitrophicus]OED69336.1 hypothetical protein OAU_09355 [Vibrio cyclitrophicus ZF99]PME46088.1 hypothetical protein BCV35_17300 [Vibrio cyclitrophicus]
MEKFHCLVDSSFNLLKASEKNQTEIQNAIKILNGKSNALERTSENIEKRVSNAIVKSSNESSELIANRVLSDLNEVNEKAKLATIEFEKIANFSILKVSSIFFIFFLIAGSLLWFFFIKDIPTIEYIYKLRAEKSALEKDINELKQYGNVSYCDKKPCIQVDPSTTYGEDKLPYYVIAPQK